MNQSNESAQLKVGKRVLLFVISTLLFALWFWLFT